MDVFYDFHVGIEMAINSKTVEVKFNKEVDVTSAIVKANYKVGSLTIDSATLATDKKTVTLILADATPITSVETSYTVDVSGVKDLAGKTVTYAQSLKLKDQVRPTLGDIVWEDNKTISLLASEFVKATDGTFSANEVTITDANGVVKTGHAVSYSAATKKISVDVSGASLAPGTYTVKVTGVSDFATNLLNPNPTVKTFTVTKDLVAPVASEVLNYGHDGTKAFITVKFSEKLAPDTITTGVPFNVSLDAGSALSLASTAFTPVGDNTYVVDLGTQAAGLKTVKVSGFKDLGGNAGTDKSAYVTFAAAAPKFESAKYYTDSTGANKIVVKFDRSLKSVQTPAQIAAASVTYITTTGVETVLANPIAAAAITVADIDNDNSFELVIDADNYTVAGVGSELKLPGGTYSVKLPASYVTDYAGQNNAPTTVNFTVPTGATAVEATKVSSATYATGEVTVVYDQAVGQSALNLENYKVEGKTVFNKAVFTDTTYKTVKLTVAPESFDITGPYVIDINNVLDSKDKAVTVYSKTITNNVLDNVAPKIAKAEVTANNKIKLTFTEALLTGTTNVDGADFEVTVGGTKATVGTTATDGTNVVVLTITGTTVATIDTVVTVKTLNGNDLVDLSTLANDLVKGQVINAAWAPLN